MQTRSSALAATQQPTAPVLDIGSLPLQLEDLTRERIKALPKPALQELSVLLAEMDLCRTRPVMARPSRYDGSRLRLCGR